MAEPQVYDHESITLSAMLRSMASRRKYLQLIDRQDFMVKTHADIFDAVIRMAQATEHIEREAVSAMFTDTITRTTVALLYDTAIPELTPEIFAEFKRSGMRTRLLKIPYWLQKQLDAGVDSDVLLEGLRTKLTEIDETNTAVDVSEPDMSVDATLAMMDEWAAMADDTPRTFIPELDDELFLNRLVGYTVVGGASGAGKSALLCQIMKSNARNGIAGALFSIEMRKEMLYMRMALEYPRLRGTKLSHRVLRDKQKMSDLRAALDDLRSLPIYVVDGVSNIFAIKSIARKLSLTKNIKVVGLDYIQLAQTHIADQPTVRVGKVSNTLQSLSKPDGEYPALSVVALSQYSNDGSKDVKANKKASNDNFYWSGQIKQDADTTLHLIAQSQDNVPILDVDIFCDKQRYDNMGWTVRTQFDKQAQRFLTPLINKMDIAGDNPARPRERRPATF